MNVGRGVTLEELRAKHEGPYRFNQASYKDKEERFLKFSAIALNSRAFVDKALALHLPLESHIDPRELSPLVKFAAEASANGTFKSDGLLSCYLPQLNELNVDQDSASLLGPTRDLNFKFTDGNRTLDLWNQMGGDLMQAMAAMRIIKMGLSDDRPDGLHGNADEDQMEETINTIARVGAISKSEMVVSARAMIVNERRAAADRAASENAPAPSPDFLLSEKLKENVFKSLDELSAMSSLQFGCCQETRSVISGMRKLQDSDTLLKLTIKQACEDSSMAWFRYYMRSERRRAKDDLYSFVDGRSTTKKSDPEDVDVGLEPGEALRPPWVDKGEKLGDWRQEGCYVVIVPLLHSSLAASSVVGATAVPGSLITSAVNRENGENGEIYKRRLRTPVAFCFVGGRGRILNRHDLQQKRVVLPPSPRVEPGEMSGDANVFLTDCGASLMLALGRACNFLGTVFMTP